MGEPSRAKLHSKRLADEYVRLGWHITLEFRVPGHDEPYEIILVRQRPGEPVYPEAWDPPCEREHTGPLARPSGEQHRLAPAPPFG